MKTISSFTSILFIFGILLLSNFHQKVNAQTLTIYADTLTADKGDTLAVDIKVKDFKEIFALIFAVQWEETVLEFVDLNNFAALPYFSSLNFNLRQLDIGVTQMAWFDASGLGMDLSDDAILFTLSFKIIGDRGTTSVIEIGDYFSFKAEATTPTKALSLDLNKGLVQVKSPPPPSVSTMAAPVIPTLSQWGIFILGLLILNMALMLILCFINIPTKSKI